MDCKYQKRIIVGIDESGRGPLAGPVVAAAVLVKNPKFPRPSAGAASGAGKLENLKDSKKLTPKKKEEIYKILKSSPQVEWGIGKVSEKVIDRINILQATKLAMVRAIRNLNLKIKNEKLKIDFLLIDGNLKIDLDIPQKSVIRGDEKVFLIKLASIAAKVTRDRTMLRYHKKYPEYHFDRHKGYGTKLHLKILKKYGPSVIHRLTFHPIKN